MFVALEVYGVTIVTRWIRVVERRAIQLMNYREGQVFPRSCHQRDGTRRYERVQHFDGAVLNQTYSFLIKKIPRLVGLYSYDNGL